ncbi:MAG: glutamine amidotransferase [Candidatus Saccharimonadales bacterium]
MNKPIQILFLYPNEMNIYGDTGNVIVLKQRLLWRGIDAEVTFHHPGKPFNHKPDIIVGGGGQDSGQRKVFTDLLENRKALHELANKGVPMLMICGLYQLFGHRFITHNGDDMPGISIFDAETRATDQRLIGNVAVETDFGVLVGYENHSGQTALLGEQKPFGKTIKGYGNDATSGHEGAICNNVYGTYMHGSLLPKNPTFADELLSKALQNRSQHSELLPLDDSHAHAAHKAILKRM